MYPKVVPLPVLTRHSRRRAGILLPDEVVIIGEDLFTVILSPGTAWHADARTYPYDEVRQLLTGAEDRAVDLLEWLSPITAGILRHRGLYPAEGTPHGGGHLYAVQAFVTKPTEEGGYSSSRALPTFYLDPRVQGITSAEHARAIAEDVTNPWREWKTAAVVERVDP